MNPVLPDTESYFMISSDCDRELLRSNLLSCVVALIEVCQNGQIILPLLNFKGFELSLIFEDFNDFAFKSELSTTASPSAPLPCSVCIHIPISLGFFADYFQY